MTALKNTALGFVVCATLLGSVGYVDAADRALLIGLDQYSDKRLSFKVQKSAANDVESMKSVLVSKQGFAAENVKILHDGAATKQAILAEIENWLGAGTKPGERAVFYFAGHGYFQKDTSGDEKDGLDETLVPFDAVLTGEKSTPITGMVSDDELNAALAKLSGRRVSVIVDAGHSGTLTRAIVVEAKALPEARSPQLVFATRAITVEPRLKAQKLEGVLIDKKIPKGSLTSWSAVSSSQRALINTEGAPRGVFTGLYVEGIAQAKADLNGNGVITNAELLSYITKGSKAYCGRHKQACVMGLTPRLEPAEAFGRNVATGIAKKPAKITPDVITDFLAKGNVHGVVIQQIPKSPVFVGARDIRFRVVSPHDGYLILLNLTDKGDLLQLFPNAFSRKHDRDGKIRGNSPMTIPDDYYGLKFHATAPSTGQIIALVAREKIDLPKAVKTRSIEVIPRQQVAATYLPELAASLSRPAHAGQDKINTKAVDWSVATLKYAIVPRK